jgi:CBS domain-containing protein
MLARDVMTIQVVPLYEKSSLDLAIELMLKLKVSGFPVVDDRGQLVGMLTEGDLLRRAELDTDRKRPRWLEFLLGPGRLAEDYVKTHARRVDEVMTRKVHSVHEATPLGDVVDLMSAHGVKRVPVVRDGAPVGIISRADLVQALGTVLHAGARRPKLDDVGIKTAIADALSRQSWAPQAPVGVQVRDGHVELRGVLTDDRQRDAVRVAVENIPGVKSVTDNFVFASAYPGELI